MDEIKTCDACRYYDCSKYVIPCGTCDLDHKNFEKADPITNADFIRSMTDEELSFFLANAYALGAIQEKCGSKAWLKWLKQENE